MRSNPLPPCQELELYKKLKHKHVVGYIDASFEPRTNTLFIFLEYVPGEAPERSWWWRREADAGLDCGLLHSYLLS